MIREEQAKAGITQKSAAILMREDKVKLLQKMSAWLMNPKLTVDEKYEMMRNMAFIAVVFATGKRCDYLANCLFLRWSDSRMGEELCLASSLARL